MYRNIMFLYTHAYIYIYIYSFIYLYACKRLQPNYTIGLQEADLMQQNSSHQNAIKKKH